MNNKLFLKIFCVLIVPALAFSFAGCGKKSAEKTAAEESAVFVGKLKAGKPINLLVVGDSISELPNEPWTFDVAQYITDTYHSEVETLENISMGGNSSYAGFIRSEQLDDGIDYDLVLFCHGQNDGTESPGFWYEAMIRACRKKYPNASMISVLQSSQRTFTKTVQSIQMLAQHYGIYPADTITPTNDGSRGAYETFTDDGVHPNAAGQQVYAEVVEGVIDQMVKDNKPLPAKEIAPVSEGLDAFEKVTFLTFEDIDSYDSATYTYTFVAKEDLAGDLGLDYAHIKMEQPNRTVIRVAGKELKTLEVDWSMWGTQRHITHVGEFSVKKGETVTISFVNEESADSFNGICIAMPAE